DDRAVDAKGERGPGARTRDRAGAADPGSVPRATARRAPQGGSGGELPRGRGAEIADGIEGQLYPMFCLEPTDHTCFADSRCGLQGFWGEVARAIDGVFQRTTVADLADRHQRTAGPTVFA